MGYSKYSTTSTFFWVSRDFNTGFSLLYSIEFEANREGWDFMFSSLTNTLPHLCVQPCARPRAPAVNLTNMI